MATSDAQKLKRQVDEALELIDLMKRTRLPVPPQIESILNAMKEGAEIGMSAEEASRHFALFLKDMDAQCALQEAKTGEDPYVCLARRERTEGSLSYAGRVKFLLDPKNSNSVVSLYWKTKARSGFACLWDEVKNGSPTGLYRKCFITEGSFGHLPKSAP